MTIFTDQAAAVESLRADRLVSAASTYFPDFAPSETYLWGKILSAEKYIERKLRVFLEPVEVLPDGATDDERAAFDAAGTRWVEEPGYDLSGTGYNSTNWMLTQLRHRPLIAVHGIRFMYPNVGNNAWDVPANWIRIDKKASLVRLVPASGSFSSPMYLPVTPWMLGGAKIPQAIQVRYQTGLEDAPNKHPDVVDLVLKQAVLSVIKDQFLPASGSISGDGFSQTLSADAGKLQDQVDAETQTIRESLRGLEYGIL